MQNENWRVDYEKIPEAMRTDKAGGLFGKLNEIGKKLQEQLENSADGINAEMEQLGEKLEELSDQVERDAAKGIEQFADELEKSIKELEESIDRSLKDKRRWMPEQNDGLQET